LTAIRAAVNRSSEGDVVLVAGKGHEDSQTAGAVTLPFDDRVVAAEALDERFGGTPSGGSRPGRSDR
jgi:UDP-N-acetylmuramoyl-L-alanyl-D-glutamate--2,6-diaminopimelate ligase